MFKKAIKTQNNEDVTSDDTKVMGEVSEEITSDATDVTEEVTSGEISLTEEVSVDTSGEAVAQERERILSILDVAKVENKVAIAAIKNGLSVEVASDIIEASVSGVSDNSFNKAVEASEVEVSTEEASETDDFMETYRACRNG